MKTLENKKFIAFLALFVTLLIFLFTPDSSNSEKLELEHQRRAMILKNECSKLNLANRQLSGKMNLEFLMIDEKHKLLYCRVPKVACTNWKWIFLEQMGKVNETNQEDISEGLSKYKK